MEAYVVKRRFIIDTDTGADDASALILAAMNKDIEIIGVTTLVGNVDMEQSTKNAIMALETAGINVPVYQGSRECISGKELEAFSVFGKDGMGDADLIHPKGKASEGAAIDFIIDTVRKYPGEIEIVSIGPATNIAMAMQKAPDAMRQIKRIWSMATAGLGHGNASPVAEFNVYADPEAYKIMLDFGIPVTVIGLDMCDGDSLWTNENFEELNRSNDIGRFVAASFHKLREFYAMNSSADAVMNCDSVAMMCALRPEFVKQSIETHASCITEPGETLAQVIFYKKGFIYDVVTNDFDYNVTLVTEVDGKNYFKYYMEAIQNQQITGDN